MDKNTAMLIQQQSRENVQQSLKIYEELSFLRCAEPLTLNIYVFILTSRDMEPGSTLMAKPVYNHRQDSIVLPKQQPNSCYQSCYGFILTDLKVQNFMVKDSF